MLYLYSCDCIFRTKRDTPHADGTSALKFWILIHDYIIDRTKALAQSALYTFFLIYYRRETVGCHQFKSLVPGDRKKVFTAGVAAIAVSPVDQSGFLSCFSGFQRFLEANLFQ